MDPWWCILHPIGIPQFQGSFRPSPLKSVLGGNKRLPRFYAQIAHLEATWRINRWSRRGRQELTFDSLSPGANWAQHRSIFFPGQRQLTLMQGFISLFVTALQAWFHSWSSVTGGVCRRVTGSEKISYLMMACKFAPFFQFSYIQIDWNTDTKFKAFFLKKT